MSVDVVRYQHPPSHRRQRRVGKPDAFEVSCFLYLPFLAAVTSTFSASVDDPFITLRYAANIVHGLGAVFNRGQHVQGFTSPLHLFLAVIVYLTPGGHDFFKLKLASVLFGALAIREAGRLIYGIDIPRWACRAGCVAVSTSWILAFSSSNGLETTLTMWLLIALLRRLVLSGPTRQPLTLVTFAFAAVLARPDALLAIAAIAAAGLLIESQLRPWQRIAWVSGALLGSLGLVAVGVLYFGDALPNTYYAKDMTLRDAIPRGFHYLIGSPQPGILSPPAGSHVASDLLLMVQVALLCLGILFIVKRMPRAGYLIAVVAAQTVFILKSGGDWMEGVDS